MDERNAANICFKKAFVGGGGLVLFGEGGGLML